MKGIFNLTETYTNKKITVQVPNRYAEGTGYDLQRMLEDNQANHVINGSNKAVFSNCEIGYSIYDGEKPNLVIEDK